MLKNKIVLILAFFGLYSCQQVVTLDKMVFDYTQFSKITISAEQKNISTYESNINDSYIGYYLEIPPNYYLNEWIENNIIIFGSENQLTVNIINASLKKSEVPNSDLNKNQEKKIFLFELIFIVEFILYDDYDTVLSSSIVETSRTTTSGKYISINETEKIIDNLIFDCLTDFSMKAKETIYLHMKNFII